MLIVEGGGEYCAKCAALLKTYGFDTVVAPKDGLAVAQLIGETRPKVVLMDVFMPRLDAIGVMNSVKEMGLGYEPRFMVTSTFSNQMLENELMSAGACYFFLMPFDPEVMVERIVKLAGVPSAPIGAGAEHAAGGEPNLELMVTEIIHQIGVPAHIKGYHYVRESIMLAVQTPEIINSVTKLLYPPSPKSSAPPPRALNARSATRSRSRGTAETSTPSTATLDIRSTTAAASRPTANSSR